jgi:putative SOS response-associated peptidase YedK
MCGRFTLRTPASVIAEQFGLFEVPALAARFNIAPSQPVAVVRARSDLLPGSPAAGASGTTQERAAESSPSPIPPRRELALLRWGLVPSWAKDATIGSRLINARAETAAEKPAFRAAMSARRCLVIADGFYEWQRTGRAKQPYFFQLRRGRPLAFAGLWEAWRGPDHTLLETCTLLTTAANDLIRAIHDRMPVILGPAAYDAWLDPGCRDPRPLLPLLAPCPSDEMETFAVGNFVNSPSHESPRCIEPLS